MKKPSIQFEESQESQRPDVVNVCKNCGEVSASHFLTCPVCNTKESRKKMIHFYKNDLSERQYPIMFLNKTELVNNFISKKLVDILNEQDMIALAMKMEKVIRPKYKELITYAFSNYKKNFT